MIPPLEVLREGFNTADVGHEPAVVTVPDPLAVILNVQAG
jgi:hypothetical protein